VDLWFCQQATLPSFLWPKWPEHVLLEMVKVDHLYLLKVLFTNVVNTVHSALGYKGFYYYSNSTDFRAIWGFVDLFCSLFFGI